MHKNTQIHTNTHTYTHAQTYINTPHSAFYAQAYTSPHTRILYIHTCSHIHKYFLSQQPVPAGLILLIQRLNGFVFLSNSSHSLPALLLHDARKNLHASPCFQGSALKYETFHETLTFFFVLFHFVEFPSKICISDYLRTGCGPEATVTLLNRTELLVNGNTFKMLRFMSPSDPVCRNTKVLYSFIQ